MTGPRSQQELQSWIERAIEAAAEIERENPEQAQVLLDRALRWEERKAESWHNT